MKLIFLLALFSASIAQSQVVLPDLINGRPAEAGEFPEAVYVSFGNSRCTGSIIGKRVLLSAAHCAGNGSTGRFQVGQDQYTATCTRHPRYPGQDVDLLLCKTNREVNVIPATIGGPVEVDQSITIVGYGCVRPGGGGGNDGVLRVGDARVTGFSNYDIVSRGAGLCYGDSGGPAYKKLTDAFSEKHIQVSVNSKGNIRNTNYTTRTYIDISKDWMRSWAETNAVDICGVTSECGDTPPPPPPGDCQETYQMYIEKRSESDDALEDLMQCLAQ